MVGAKMERRGSAARLGLGATERCVHEDWKADVPARSRLKASDAILRTMVRP